MKKVKNIVFIFMGSLLVLFIIGFSIGSTNTMPGCAAVYADDNKKVYYSPTYLRDNNITAQGLRLTTGSEVYNKKYNPESDCRDTGYFEQDGRSLSGMLLEKIGILPKLDSRWDSDGNWRY